MPDDALLAAWCMASRRGVRVTLLLPACSNHYQTNWARERALRELHDAGARLYLFPGMMHAKAVIIDDALALCGSANLDRRSFFLNVERMTAFYGAMEIGCLVAWLERKVLQSGRHAVRRRAWWRDVIEGMVGALGFHI